MGQIIHHARSSEKVSLSRDVPHGTCRGSRMMHMSLTGRDGRSTATGHDLRRVVAAVAPDLPAHARAAPADGSHVQHQGHRAPRAGEGLVVRGPLRGVGADMASPSTPSRAITPSELRPTLGGAGGVGTATGVTVATNSA